MPSILTRWLRLCGWSSALPSKPELTLHTTCYLCLLLPLGDCAPSKCCKYHGRLPQADGFDSLACAWTSKTRQVRAAGMLVKGSILTRLVYAGLG